MLRFLIRRYCCRQTIWVITSTMFGLELVFVGVMFATSGSWGTIEEGPLGGDYGQFHTIGLLQNRYGIDSLYDLNLQDRIIRASVPGFPTSASLPFVYPPFVAPPFRMLAMLPYAWSYAAWLVVSAGLYIAAVALVLRVCPALAADRLTVWLLAMSFTPFAFETLAGGQLSSIGALAVALAIVCHRTGRSGWAGFALSLLLYKPTLLGLIGVMLLAGRRWMMLAGFAAGGCLLAGLSIAAVGVDGSVDYVEFLLWYGRVREEHSAVFKTVKYLDLTTSLTLIGLERGAARILAISIAVPVVALLALAWHRSRHARQTADLTWAATLCFLPLITNYGPMYDAALVVPGLILGADVIRQRNPDSWPAGFSALIGLIYFAGILSSLLVTVIGVQALTPALFVMGIYLLRAALQDENPITSETNDIRGDQPLGASPRFPNGNRTLARGG